MKITLYKNCIVSPDYTDIFRHSNLLEEYLLSLDKKEIILDEGEVYPQITDTIYFDYIVDNVSNSSIYDYNYIRIENSGNLNIPIIYAFIRSIIVSNAVATVNYITDVWHTFDGKWKIKRGILTNSRFVEDYNINYKFMPYDPLITKSPNFINVFNQYYSPPQSQFTPLEQFPTEQMYIAIEIYRYKTEDYKQASVGNSETIISSFDVLLPDLDPNGIKFGELVYKVNQMIRNLINAQVNDTNSYLQYRDINIQSGTYVKYPFQIRNIYLFKADDIFYEIQRPTSDDGTEYFSDYKITDEGKIYHFTRFTPFDYIIETRIIDKDYHITHFGFFNKFYPIKFNNNNYEFNIRIINDGERINFFIESYMGRENITSIFNHIPTISSISAEDFNSRKLNKEFEDFSISMQNVNAIGQGVGGVAKGVGQMLPNATNLISGLISGDPISGAVGGMLKGGGDIISSVSSTISQVGTILEKRNLLNANIYSNGAVISQPSIALITFWFDTMIMKYEFSNEEEIENLINEYGWQTEDVIYSILENTSNNEKYDYIQFSGIDIYGLSQDWLNIIKSILTNKFRIWYTSNVEI